MIELTQPILSLDTESEKALKTADLAALEIMKKADAHAAQILAEEQHLFAKQKEQDMVALEEKLVVQRQEEMTALKQKMDTYNNSLDVEKLTEQLLSIAKDRVCR